MNGYPGNPRTPNGDGDLRSGGLRLAEALESLETALDKFHADFVQWELRRKRGPADILMWLPGLVALALILGHLAAGDGTAVRPDATAARLDAPILGPDAFVERPDTFIERPDAGPPPDTTVVRPE